MVESSGTHSSNSIHTVRTIKGNQNYGWVYYAKSKYSEFAALHPGKKPSEIRKLLGWKYRQLSPKEKAHYGVHTLIKSGEMGDSASSDLKSDNNDTGSIRQMSRRRHHFSCAPDRLCQVIDSLSDAQKEVIRRVGFQSIVNMDNPMFSKDLVLWLCEQYNSKQCSINIHGQVIDITTSAFEEVMGIGDGGEKIVLCDDNNKYKLKETLLKGRSCLSLQETGNELISTTDCGKIFVIKFILFAISTVLMPNTSVNVNLRYLRHLKDINRIRRKNWASCSIDILTKALAKFKDRKSTYINGCTLFLQLLYFHHVQHDQGYVDRSVLPLQYWSSNKCQEIISWIYQNGGIGTEKVCNDILLTSVVNTPSTNKELQNETSNGTCYHSFEEVQILKANVDELEAFVKKLPKYLGELVSKGMETVRGTIVDEIRQSSVLNTPIPERSNKNVEQDGHLTFCLDPTIVNPTSVLPTVEMNEIDDDAILEEHPTFNLASQVPVVEFSKIMRVEVPSDVINMENNSTQEEADEIENVPRGTNNVMVSFENTSLQLSPMVSGELRQHDQEKNGQLLSTSDDISNELQNEEVEIIGNCANDVTLDEDNNGREGPLPLADSEMIDQSHRQKRTRCISIEKSNNENMDSNENQYVKFGVDELTMCYEDEICYIPSLSSSHEAIDIVQCKRPRLSNFVHNNNELRENNIQNIEKSTQISTKMSGTVDQILDNCKHNFDAIRKFYKSGRFIAGCFKLEDPIELEDFKLSLFMFSSSLRGSEILVVMGKMTLDRCYLSTLKPKSHIGGNIINCYSLMLTAYERARSTQNKGKVWYFPVQILDKAMNKCSTLTEMTNDQHWVECYFGKLELCEQVIIPLLSPETTQHWFILRMSLGNKSVEIWDSQKSAIVENVRLLAVKEMLLKLEKLFGELYNKHEEPYVFSTFTITHTLGLPQQYNNHDSGVYVIKFMDCISRKVFPIPEFEPDEERFKIALKVVSSDLNEIRDETIDEADLFYEKCLCDFGECSSTSLLRKV